MRQQIQLWQHSKSLVNTIMFVVRLHQKLLKVLSLNLKLEAQFSISKMYLRDLKTAALLKNIETVRLSVIEYHVKIHWKRAQVLKMKQTSLLTILKKNKFIPHKCQTLHQLGNANKTARLAMCHRFRQEIKNANDWINIALFTDEAHFYLDGSVNSQNCRVWGKNERPLHSDEYTVVCFKC